MKGTMLYFIILCGMLVMDYGESSACDVNYQCYIKDLHHSVNKLNESVDAQVISLQKELEEERVLRKKLQKDLEEDQVLRHTLQEELNALKANVSDMRDKFVETKTAVGFSAYNSSTNSGVLKFVTIVSNFGNHYDISTGKFVCPTPGAYLFSFAVRGDDLTHGNYFARAWLKLNGSKKSSALCNHQANEEADMTCGNTVLLQCQGGDKVWMEGSGKIHGSDYVSSFTGVLLYYL